MTDPPSNDSPAAGPNRSRTTCRDRVVWIEIPGHQTLVLGRDMSRLAEGHDPQLYVELVHALERGGYLERRDDSSDPGRQSSS